MAEEAELSDERITSWIGRARAVPSRVEGQRALLDELRELIHRDLHLDVSSNAHLHALLHEVQQVLEKSYEAVRLGEVVEAQGHDHEAQLQRVLGRLQDLDRHIGAADRDAAMQQLLERLGPPAPLEPGLSVLIPTWNHAARLAPTLDAALEVVEPHRVLVLDDASTDGTPGVLADRPGIRVLRPERNIGLTRARNVLVHAAGTTRALNLDADNLIDPDGIRLLDEMAAEWSAAVTYGALVEVDEDGAPITVISARPMDGAFFAGRHNAVDSLAVLDVAAVRAAGGYTLDPALETCEDWDMWHRLAVGGGLLLYVPTVAGRKLRAATGHNAQPQDRAHQLAIIRRTYRTDGRLSDERVASAVVHPDTGPLWASEAAMKAHPQLRAELGERLGQGAIPAAPPVTPAPPSILLVGSGGVRNLGDDATTAGTLRRLRTLLDPEIGIELVTDGPRPLGDLAPAVWLGTVREFANRPLDHHLAVVMSGGGTLSDEFAEQTASRQAIAAQAARAGVPVLLTGQGLGPLSGRPSALPALVPLVTALSVRDPISYDLALALGAREVALIGDDAASADVPAERPAALRHVSPAGWIAFNGRLAGYSGAAEADLEAWAAAVDEAAGARGVDVVALAQNRQEPWELQTLSALAAQARHAPWHVVDVTEDLDTARSAYGLAQAVVARSYHAVWFALSGGVPALMPADGEYYRQKAEGLRRLLDLPEAFLVAAPPTGADELEQRLAAVAPAARAARLADVDEAATAWLETKLTELGARRPPS